MKHCSNPAGIRYKHSEAKIVQLGMTVHDRTCVQWHSTAGSRSEVHGDEPGLTAQGGSETAFTNIDDECFQNILPSSPTSSTPCHDAVEVARGGGEVGRKNNRYKDIPLGARSHQPSEVPMHFSVYPYWLITPHCWDRWTHALHSSTCLASTAHHKLEGHPPAQALMTLSGAPSATSDLIPLPDKTSCSNGRKREHCTCLLQTPTPHHILAGATKPQ